MINWLVWGMPRELVTLFWVCLWGCVSKRLRFEPAYWAKITLIKASGHHLIWYGQVELKGRERPNLLSAWAGMSLFCCPWTSPFLVLWLLDSDGDVNHLPPFLKSSGLDRNYWLSWTSSLQANCSASIMNESLPHR